ncbi:helix-turn-helix domain-containing protein [Streptomyces sp. uw30]|uniref:helix-turn-helix domain-containing protein n=1 Tax=Streptomyces sp. uw30 TaxID=1828179 RepID=UPI003967DBE9
MRREEVARLAGGSTDNYACHEQGRRITPSPVVVEALGCALGLDAAERAHLQDLIGVTAPLRRRPAASSVSAPGLYHGMNSPALTEVIRVGLYMIFKRRD